MRISIIVAMTGNRVIGRGGAMPWHLPADLKRFKELTMGSPIIMGRKTFESLPGVLPGRRHIVISRNPDYRPAGVEVVGSLDAALAAASDAAEVFVIGGADIFREALPRADRLYATLIDTEMEGDTFFPEFDIREWREVASSVHVPDQANLRAITFKVMDRKGP
jgi:dihydrofolate reductase